MGRWKRKRTCMTWKKVERKYKEETKNGDENKYT